MQINQSKKIIDLLLHPALLALPVALAFIFLIPDVFKKYKIEVLYERIMNPGSRIEYHDLNNDGISEWFITGVNDSSSSNITIHNRDGIIDQWNIPDFQSDLAEHIITGDFDGDRHLEIYPLLYRNDSLFVSSIDYRQKGRFIFRDRFITVVKESFKQPFAVRSGYLTDLNSDGAKELIIPVSAGFTLTPRKIFVCDIVGDTVIESIDLGVSIGKVKYFDLDADGIDELILGTTASANSRDSGSGMNDHSAYIAAMNHNLEFLFKPVAFPGDYHTSYNFPYVENGKAFIGSFLQQYGSEKHIKPQIQIRDIHGKLIRYRESDENFRGPQFSVINLQQKNGNTCLLKVMTEKGIILLDQHLRDQRSIDLKSSEFTENVVFDADNDGNDELLLQSNQTDRYHIVSHDLRNISTFTVEKGEGLISLSMILNGDDPPLFSLSRGIYNYQFSYSFNIYYYWKYPFFISIYLSVFLLLLLIRNHQRNLLRKKFETEKKLAELQLLSLRNQMDPHFTFNVLNTIGAAILQNKNEESYNLLLKFSRMIRTTVSSSDQIYRSLQEELDFVKNYLDLQIIRCNGSFSYTVEMDQTIDPVQPVPKMILQTYVENALKHGLIPKKSGGLLKISAVREEQRISLTIEDNGIGRQQAQINGTLSTGVGLKIMRQYYELLNRNNQFHITEEFSDLYDENGKAAGTRVVICIPEGYIFAGSPLRSE